MGTDNVALDAFVCRETERERRQQHCKRCYNCSEPIEQSEAFHLELTTRSGKIVDFWICDDCIEKMKDYTGRDEDEE